MNITMESTEISVYDLENFESKVTELNRKLARHSAPAIAYTVGEKSTVKLSGKHWYDPDIQIVVYAVTVSYPALQIEGYKVAGKVNHIEKLVNPLPNMTVPELYRNSEPKCDHCGTNRDRNTTYILIDTEGNYKQVGGNCLGLFLGVDPGVALMMSDTAALVRDLNANELDEDEDEVADRIPRHLRQYGLEKFLWFVAQQIRLFGWVSKSEMYKTPTANRAFDDMYNKDATEPSEDDKALAQAAVTWASELIAFDCSDYLLNIRQIAINGFCTEKTIGYAASIIPAYNRHLQDTATNKAGGFVGSVGDKVTMIVTLAHTSTPIYTTYGMLYINTFIDNSGNTIVWKTGKQADTGSFTMKATIKAHDTYKGVNQTIVERPKFIAA